MSSRVRTSPSLADLPAPPPGRTGWPWTVETPSAPEAAARAGLPRVTIVTPSFNQTAFLEETLRSVLLQGYSNLQYIVIDGGSSDGSRAVLEKYSPWLDHWVSERDGGQSDALRKGLARSDGDWFNWINSDDTLLPGALHALASAAAATPGAAIVSGATVNVRDGSAFGRYRARVDDSPSAPFFLGVNQPGSLLRLDAVRAAGGPRLELGLCMDLDLWLRLLGSHGLSGHVAIRDEVATYRHHAASKTCREPDPFALEAFALLHDLASSLGAPARPELSALRTAHPAPYLPFPTDRFALSPVAAADAFLRRLVIDDCLLFRALLKTNRSPALRRHHLRRFLASAALPPAARARALVAAAQSSPRFDAGLYLAAFLARPSTSVLVETLRGLLRR